jgi:hypothetical protein
MPKSKNNRKNKCKNKSSKKKKGFLKNAAGNFAAIPNTSTTRHEPDPKIIDPELEYVECVMDVFLSDKEMEFQTIAERMDDAGLYNTKCVCVFEIVIGRSLHSGILILIPNSEDQCETRYVSARIKHLPICTYMPVSNEIASRAYSAYKKPGVTSHHGFVWKQGIPKDLASLMDSK